MAREEILINVTQHSEDAAEILGYKGDREDIDGVYKSNMGDIFQSEVVVVWKRVVNTLYIAVCETDDNIALLRHFLTNLNSILAELYKNPLFAVQPKELLLRPDGALGILQQLAPLGNVLVTGPSLAKYLRREGELALAQR